MALGQRLQGPQVTQIPCPLPPAEDNHRVSGSMTQGRRCFSAHGLKAGLGCVPGITDCLSELGQTP